MILTPELLELLEKYKHQIIDDFKLYLENYPDIIKHKPFLYSQKETTNVYLFRYAEYKKNPYNDEINCIIGVSFHDNFDLKTIEITNSGIMPPGPLEGEYESHFISCFPFVNKTEDYELGFKIVTLNKLLNVIIESDLSIKSENSIKFINDLINYFEIIFAKYNSILEDLNKKNETDLKNFNSENGLLKLIDGDIDFLKILKKNQTKIIEIDRNYIQKFVKIHNYLQTKKENSLFIFNELKKSNSTIEQHDMLGILKNQINTYEILVFHSINMLGSLVTDDLITFYEIYESLDKLGIFNSNWENEVSEKLTNIGDKLDDLMFSIDSMEKNIVSHLNNLNYYVQEGFSELNMNVTNQLIEINSSINTNNLLAGIQAYQLYKINKNTKSLKS